MDIQTSITTCFKKFADFNGRASRSEFWWFNLFYFMVVVVAVIIDSMFLDNSTGAGPLEIVSQIGLALPTLAVTARRLHDVNKPGWWIFAAFTIIGLIPLLIWELTPGSKKKNRYGNPIKIK